MKNILIHHKIHSDKTSTYYFTKSKRQCLSVNYNKYWDFGKDPSGAHIDQIEIFFNNSFILDDKTEIKIEDVPEAIIDVLSYLK